jgi:Lon protease-like protein
LAGAENESPDIYKVGCAGHIDEWEKFSDGRFFVHLKGVNRFRFEQELPIHRGYRRVRAIYRDFADSTVSQDWTCERQAVLDALAFYGQSQGMQVNPDQASRFSDLELVNLLGVSLPFHPAEKQALLEAPTLKEREKMLIDLLRLSTPQASESETPPRTLN